MAEIFSDIHFDDVLTRTKEENKALAEATAIMLADKSNIIIAVMPNKDGKPVFITR